MPKAPTYQDLNRQRADDAAMQVQSEQRNAVVQNTESAVAGNTNPVLAEYMSRNSGPQGLAPRDPAGEYSILADNVAKSVPDQESYSMVMVEAVKNGQIPAEAVLSDSKVLDQAKAGLVNAMRQSQGLGQVPQ